MSTGSAANRDQRDEISEAWGYTQQDGRSVSANHPHHFSFILQVMFGFYIP